MAPPPQGSVREASCFCTQRVRHKIITKSQKHMLHRTQSIVTRARGTFAVVARGRMSAGARSAPVQKITNMVGSAPIGWRIPMGVDASPSVNSLFWYLRRYWIEGVLRCYLNSERFRSGRFEFRACDLTGQMEGRARFVVCWGGCVFWIRLVMIQLRLGLGRSVSLLVLPSAAFAPGVRNTF